jgi:hypothetical protein
MAIAGSWLAGTVTPSEYVGALRWGTGINPIHAIPDSGSRETGIKENLLPLGADDGSGAIVPEELLGPEAWGYASDDMSSWAGAEAYEYVAADHPGWGEPTEGRPDRESIHPGWPSWGPHGAHDQEFPLAGYPGGDELRAQSHGSAVENARAIAVPTRGWRGGWLNKAHGAVERAETSDPSQYEVATSLVQLDKTRVNDAAAARGTDDPRAPIGTRLTGQKEKHYAKSFRMGGGPGTPDMGQQGQNLPFRPWFYRSAGLPPPPNTFYGTMSGNEPIERTLPADAGESVILQEAPADDGTYGYTEGDYLYG